MGMKMTLDDYIRKYGVESGTKRFNGMQKLLATRSETYKSHPFKRLTREWFLWRYPTDGKERWLSHVNQSRQCEENMIARHGEELGKIIWQETLRKKNTVNLVREQYDSDTANSIIQTRYSKAQETIRQTDPAILEERRNRKKESLTKYYNKIRGMSRLELFIAKHGIENGTAKYHDTMKKAFSGPNRMSAPARKIFDMMCEILSTELIDEIYCDLPGKTEFWLNDGKKLYGYDFTHRRAKVILEYNGSFWHPCEKVEELHPITKKPLWEMYENDIRKIELAEKNGFTVIIITDIMNTNEQLECVNKFCAIIRNANE